MPKKYIGRELHSLDNLIKRYIDSNLNRKVVESITGTNGWIIGYLSHHMDEDIYQRDFESEFSITRSTASKVVNLMVQKGLIERKSVPHDARLKKLVLTEKAIAVADIMEKDGETINNNLVKGFSQEEIDFILNCIERMKANVS